MEPVVEADGAGGERVDVKEIPSFEPIEQIDLPVGTAERSGVGDSKARRCSEDVQGTVVRRDGDARRRVELLVLGVPDLAPSTPVLHEPGHAIGGVRATPIR